MPHEAGKPKKQRGPSKEVKEVKQGKQGKQADSKKHKKTREVDKLNKFKEKIPYDDEYATYDRHHKDAIVGDGGYGTVYAVKRYDEPKRQYAMKILEKDVKEQSVIAEIRTLQKCQHPNVIPLVDVCKSKHTNRLSRLIFPYIDSHDYKQFFSYATRRQIRSLMKQLLEAFKFIHSKNIVHCDVKSRNLLIDKKTLHLYVIDFGQAHKSQPSKKHSYHIGTITYKPPEILMKAEHYDTSVDMWEIGRVFLDMLVPDSRSFFKIEKPKGREEGRVMLDKWAQIYGTKVFEDLAHENRWHLPAFKHRRDPGTLEDWLKHYLSRPDSNSKERRSYKTSYRFQNYCSADALDLLSRLLHPDPRKRPTAEEALAHPYFQKGNDASPKRESARRGRQRRERDGSKRSRRA
jgi:serine/threonine protein kinase